MHILIKKEELSKVEENEKIMGKIITYGGMIIIAFVVIIEIIILIILKFFIAELTKPLDIINDPYFITGQIKEEEYEKKNITLDKANIISDKKIHIDEFKELIKSVSEALKSETEFKQKINKKEEDELKLEMECLNKEFEKNKIFNIMVDENRINNILEDSNYSNEIIKHKTNIENVKNDSFVKKSHLFREFVKIDDFGEFDNSGENSFTTDNNTLFKDDNTLQNPNSLFYDLFKKEFDENYAKRAEELELEKKQKVKNYTFRYEDDPNNPNNKDKDKFSAKNTKNLFDLEKDNKIDNINSKKEIVFEKENENKLDNFMNKSDVDEEEEINFMKAYTGDMDEKEFENLLEHTNKPKKPKIEEEEEDIDI
jgi:hypothetical protein